MSRPRDGTLSMRDRIADDLLRRIERGEWMMGQRLPSMSKLSEPYGTSIRPTQQAIEALRARGHLIGRRGSGVYVRLSPELLTRPDNVLMLLRTHGHVYTDLTHLLHDRLRADGHEAAVLGIGGQNQDDIVKAVWESQSRFLIVDADKRFPFKRLEGPHPAHRHVIALINWQTESGLDRVHRILVDFPQGSRLLVEHLWGCGHRHILMAGPDDMITSSRSWDGTGKGPPATHWHQGIGIEAMWKRLGGNVTAFVCQPERLKGAVCDEDALYRQFNGSAPPSVVLGMRDIDALVVRACLQRILPRRAAHLVFFGSGNTPWSRTANPPLSTLDWNLELITQEACRIIADLKAGHAFKTPVTRLIPLRLMQRG